MTRRALMALTTLIACLLTACSARQQYRTQPAPPPVTWRIAGAPLFILTTHDGEGSATYMPVCDNGYPEIMQTTPVNPALDEYNGPSILPQRIPRFVWPSNCAGGNPHDLVEPPLHQITSPFGRAKYAVVCTRDSYALVQMSPINYHFASRLTPFASFGDRTSQDRAADSKWLCSMLKSRKRY